MGTRIKVFESTGLAPNGRLYAGDLNAIQDAKADQTNYSQQIDLGTLSVGEAALKLLRYGAGEARISGALRVDGIFRGLGGLYAGAFTTAQRDAIAAGLRPYGLIILNTTTNRPEWNSGTDASPAWLPFSDSNASVPIGTTIEWPWSHTTLPANYLLAYGQAVLKASYPVLDAIASASGYPHGSAGTTFNLPDHRGRVAAGRDDMGTVAAGRITVGVSGISGTTLGASGGVESIALSSGQLAAHSHGSVALTVTGTPALTGSPALSGAVSMTGNVALAGSVGDNIGFTDSGHVHTGTTTAARFQVPNQASPDGTIANVPASGAPSYWPVHAGAISVNSGTASLVKSGGANNGNLSVNNGNLAVGNGSLAATIGSLGVNANTLDVGGTTDSAGSGTAHQNVQPTIIVNKAIRMF